MSLILISSTKLDHAFGKSLRKRRLAKLLSQEALALESDLSRGYISDLEMGKKDPSLFTIFKLATALQLKPNTLIAETEHILQSK